VNNNTNSDLCCALRGAGAGSYGIITKFVFRLQYAPPQIFIGVLTYASESFEQVFDAWQTSNVDAPSSVTARIVMNNELMTVFFMIPPDPLTSFKI